MEKESKMKIITEKNIDDAIAYIEAHPEGHNQGVWRGTACCVLGHADVLRVMTLVDENGVIQGSGANLSGANLSGAKAPK